MQTLSKMVGQQVMLDIRPQDDIMIETVLNNLPVTPNGQFKLPNLVVGYPFAVVVRLTIPAISAKLDAAPTAELCTFRLKWQSPAGAEQPVQKAVLKLPLVSPEDYSSCQPDPEVQQQVALLLSARLKQEAMHAADQQDYSAAHNCLYEAKSIVRESPSSPALQLELVALESLEADLGARQIKKFRKRSHKAAYQTQIGF